MLPKISLLLALTLLGACSAKDGYIHDERVLTLSLKTCELEPCSDGVRGWRLHRLAWYYYVEKNYAKAETYAKEAIFYREKAFGRNAPAVATSIDNLGLVYTAQGRYADAYQAHAEACAIYKNSNAKPVDQGICVNNMAWALEHQGKLAEAEGRYLEAKQLFAAGGLDKDDVHYKTIVNNLERCRTKAQQQIPANVPSPTGSTLR